MEETIELIVKVKINYTKKSERKEAIKQAKRCTLSASVLGSVGCVSKSAKIYIEKEPRIVCLSRFNIE